MSALGDRGITLEGLAAAVDALRQELATWKALARKQDALSADQITATQSGATAAKISQIAVNTAAIQSLAAQVAGQISLAYVTTLPATGEPLTLYLVPQGDGTAPNYCNEYLWINDAWELIGTTGAMANNGELSIQVNGVTVGTFTANQAANAAVNISVPTNTNQLVNGAGYVDTAALQAALLLKQNNLTAAQLAAVDSGITAAGVQQIADNAAAIAGKQDKLSTAQQAAVDSGATVAKIDQIASNSSAIVSLTSSKQEQLTTTQLAAVNSGITAAAVQQIGTSVSNISSLQTAVSGKAADADVVHLAGTETITGDKTFTGAVATHNITPETDGTYSLGSSSYQWASVYAQTYYYNGTQWGLDTANTWTGTNKFTKAPSYEYGASATYWKRTGLTIGTNPSSNAYYMGRRTTDDNGDNSKTFFMTRGYIDSSGNNRHFCYLYNWSDITKVCYTELYINRDGSSSVYTVGANSIIPAVTRASDCGTANNKWKTLNGINPGALSLPNLNHSNANQWIDISGNITNLTGGDNWYYPAMDGWVFVITNNNPVFLNIIVFATTGKLMTGASGVVEPSSGAMWVSCPAPAGSRVRIRANNGSTGALESARFILCQGNV